MSANTSGVHILSAHGGPCESNRASDSLLWRAAECFVRTLQEVKLMFKIDGEFECELVFILLADAYWMSAIRGMGDDSAANLQQL